MSHRFASAFKKPKRKLEHADAAKLVARMLYIDVSANNDPESWVEKEIVLAVYWGLFKDDLVMRNHILSAAQGEKDSKLWSWWKTVWGSNQKHAIRVVTSKAGEEVVRIKGVKLQLTDDRLQEIKSEDLALFKAVFDRPPEATLPTEQELEEWGSHWERAQETGDLQSSQEPDKSIVAKKPKLEHVRVFDCKANLSLFSQQSILLSMMMDTNSAFKRRLMSWNMQSYKLPVWKRN